MKTTIRVLIAVLLTLLVFGGLMFLFVWQVFRLNYGHVTVSLFSVVAVVMFICSAFVVNVVWQRLFGWFETKAVSHQGDHSDR